MLLKAQIANYRSLRDENTLSLYRVGKRPKGAEDWNPVSPIAGIFGSNASGKSTVYGAIQMIGTAVSDSYRKWDPDAIALPIYPFMLALDSFETPTEFSIEFRADDGMDYAYGFSCNTDRILTEWLYQYKSSRRTILYERGLHGDIDDIRFGPSFRGSKQELKVALDSRTNALTLSVGGQMALSQLMPAYSWLTRSLVCYDSMNWSKEQERVMDDLQSDPIFRENMLRILSKADLGIVDIGVEEREPILFESDKLKTTGIDNLELQDWMVSRRKRANRILRLTHTSQDGGLAFPFSWESQGTKSFISLVAVCIRALRVGGTVLVDEIDSSLHSVLTAELISIFKSEVTNPKRAQLIFTTHDVALLSKGTAEHPLLERDQIYFVEKDRDNGSHIIALSEYAPRRGENIERGYLMGRYGGIPNPSFLESAIIAVNQSMVS